MEGKCRYQSYITDSSAGVDVETVSKAIVSLESDMAIDPQNVKEVENVAKRWSQINFEHLQRLLQKKLNEEVQAIDVRKNQCSVARQQLITESKNYYDCADKQSRKAVSPLIKAFQKEYDRVTERAKAAEAGLIFVCRAFTSVCDPSPYLEQVSTLLGELVRLYSVDEQVRNLTKQLNELQEEYGDLRNQDLTVRQLRERVEEMEAKTNSNIQAAINEKEKELHVKMETFEREVAEKREQVTAENKALSDVVADLTMKNKETGRVLEETKLQLIKKEALNDEKLEIVTNDLENALERAVEAEKKVQCLQSELERISHVSSCPNEEALGDISLIHSKDSQIHKLLEENKKLNFKLIHLKTESNKRINELTQELERHVVIVAQLRAQLEAQSDYEDNKKDLRILRSFEFGEAIEEGTGTGFVSNGVTATATATAEVQLGGRSKALDELLVGKNRKLQSENVGLRMPNQKLEEEQAIDGNNLSDVFRLADASFSNSTLADLFSDKSGQKSMEINGDLDLESDPHRATNLLNLFMCSASSSNDTPKPENYYSASTSSLHELPRTSAELRAYNELQDIVTRNIHELGPKALNTTEIAKQCKHLMVTHNIGQRLFAKYVMNQVVKSQGSLSELLSKPRHWNKLTDKGREAFRRMYGWVSDPKAIELLCNISPRRTQPVGLIEIEVPSREILWDQQAVSLAAVSKYNADDALDLFVQKQSSRVTSSDLKQRDRLSTAAAGSSTNSVVQRTSRWRHDDIPKEKIMKIYKRELALLREQESHLEQAIGSRPLSVRSKDEKLAIMETSNKSSSLSSSSSRCGSTRDTSSPPQSNFPVNSAQALFALKCRSGMASITQEELERYPVLDTEDIVRQIKDFLCLNSISQRQFGEHVLGLSQGSVSDLLARPKPWAMLTQKGREPFVRMQLFLNEAQSLVCKPEELNGKFGAVQSSEMVPRNETNNGAKQNLISGLLSMRSFPLSGEIDHETIKCRTEKAREIKKVSVLGDGDKKVMRNMKEDLLMADTSEIARQVKNRLHSSGISQKTFGDVVLGVSPGGVSELLAKPKSWEQLSPRARDLYLKMSEWLGELDENRRIQETSASTALLSSSLTPAFSSVVDTLTSTGALTKTLSPQKRKAIVNTTAAGELPKKAQRTVITDQQKEALKHVFERDQHPNQRTVEQLSQTLSLSTRTVSNWFHNYRTRQKASLRAENLPSSDNGQKRNSANGKNNNGRWKQDLAELMKLESKPYHWSPTMVSSSSNNNLTRSTVTKNSSLDKAIERIQKLNAAKQL